jgi:hypothetical protein
MLFWQPCDEEDNVAAQIAAFHARGFEGTDEYTPQGADNGEIQAGLPAGFHTESSPNAKSFRRQRIRRRDFDRESANEVKIGRWDTERRSVMVNEQRVQHMRCFG